MTCSSLYSSDSEDDRLNVNIVNCYTAVHFSRKLANAENILKDKEYVYVTLRALNQPHCTITLSVLGISEQK